MSIYHTPGHPRITGREIAIAAGVLAVLAGVLAIIFSKQSNDAVKVAQSRNLQRWGIALNLYLIDNDNQLPAVGSEPIDAEQDLAWYNALPPYISETPLANLPEGDRPRPGVPSLWINPTSEKIRSWDPTVFFFNYGMNRFLQPQEDIRSFRIFEIPTPGQVIFMTPTEGYSPASTPDTVTFPASRTSSNRPGDTAHILFCDGHVELVTRQELVGGEDGRATVPDISWFRD